MRLPEQARPHLDRVEGQINVVDVGSHVGIFTISVLTAYPSAFCWCYEPNPGVQERLGSNLAKYEGRYEIRQLALGKAAGSGTLKVPKKARNEGLATLGDPRRFPVKESHSRTVKVGTLDTEFADKVVHLIKIDVEGMELHVVEGGVKLIKAQYPFIVYEFSNMNAAQFGLEAEDTEKKLKELGYTQFERVGPWDRAAWT